MQQAHGDDVRAALPYLADRHCTLLEVNAPANDLAPLNSALATSPALVIDGKVLTEVAATLFYLARAFPQAGLMPAGVLGEAEAISWMSFDASTLHPAVGQGPERVAETWRIAEQKLGGRQWCVGDKYSIADIHLFRLYWRFKDRFDLKAAEHPSVHSLYKRMMERPAVKKTIEIEAKVPSSLPA